MILNNELKRGYDDRLDIVAKRTKLLTRRCVSFLGMLCRGKYRVTEAKQKKEINLLSFIFRRPYKIILQRNKDNEMKVMEQCIESGRQEFFFLFKRHVL